MIKQSISPHTHHPAPLPLWNCCSRMMPALSVVMHGDEDDMVFYAYRVGRGADSCLCL